MMTVYLVRHSLAVPKKRWKGDDGDRPLTKRGLAQSEVLATWSMGIALSSILSSPTRRCFDTVAAVAVAHDLTVLARRELAISDGHKARDLVAASLADDADVLICTHGEIVLPVLRGLRPRPNPRIKAVASKGSVWALTKSERGLEARYASNADLLRSGASRNGS